MIDDFIDFNMDHICVLFFLTAKSSDGVLWNSSRHGIGTCILMFFPLGIYESFLLDLLVPFR